MGITRQAAKLMFQAHSERALDGEYLSIGKQTVNISREELSQLGLQHIGPDYVVPTLADLTTRHAHGNISDRALVGSISGSLRYNCLDRSDYEGANIIADMNYPIAGAHKARYDFIYDGSCIDNVFDPAVFLRNVSEMLRTGGRCLIAAHASLYPGAFLMFSPEWFFSFFAVNGYRSCRVLLADTRCTGGNWLTSVSHLFEYSPYFSRDPQYDRFAASKIDSIYVLYVLAEKGDASTSHNTPIQLQYADADHVRSIQEKYDEWARQYRPIPLERLAPEPRRPLLSDHFSYLGTY